MEVAIDRLEDDMRERIQGRKDEWANERMKAGGIAISSSSERERTYDTAPMMGGIYQLGGRMRC